MAPPFDGQQFVSPKDSQSTLYGVFGLRHRLPAVRVQAGNRPISQPVVHRLIVVTDDGDAEE
jgi:hypothetical protein